MRHLLISALLLGLVAGCSGNKIGPYHIDVQQGNALDQENVARLKPGLSRSQVRFLLGTPLVVDPFRTDRWDYVYLYYKAGSLTEQKRISLFFDGDTLVRIEGDLPQPAAQPPAPTPPAKPEANAETAAPPAAGEKVQPNPQGGQP
jgi:outer membrane protein assembly factor BamE